MLSYKVLKFNSAFFGPKSLRYNCAQKCTCPFSPNSQTSSDQLRPAQTGSVSGCSTQTKTVLSRSTQTGRAQTRPVPSQDSMDPPVPHRLEPGDRCPLRYTFSGSIRAQWSSGNLGAAYGLLRLDQGGLRSAEVETAQTGLLPRWGY